MNLKLLLSVLALAVLGAGWVAGAGAGADYGLRSRSASIQAATPARPELDMFSAKPRLGVKAPTEIGFRIPATAAEVEKWTLYVPAGYGFGAADPPGTPEGHVALETASDIGLGDLKAADPAKYVNSPQAQACAPGSHAAVWVMKFDGLASTPIPTIPIYIDPTSGTDTALGAYELQACLPLAELESPGGPPLGSRLRTLALEFTHLTNPAASSLYVWRAFVSNPDTSGNPDPSTTYELRADMPLPAKLTLTTKYDRKHHRARLSGRLTTPAMPVAGIPVGLFRPSGLFGWKFVAGTRTATDGSYTFSRTVKKSTTFGAAASSIGDCNGASIALNGCLDETLAEIDSPSVRVVVPRHR